MLGLLAEPRARDGRDAEREQRLGRRRDQRDDPHARRAHMRSSSCAFFASNSAARDVALVAQLGELLDLLGDRRSRPRPRRARRGRPSASAGPTRALAGVRPPSAGRSPAAPRRGGARCRSATARRCPADSISRSPAPMTRSKMRWWKLMLLMRSSGISTPRFDTIARAEDHAAVGEDEVREVPVEVASRPRTRRRPRSTRAKRPAENQSPRCAAGPPRARRRSVARRRRGCASRRRTSGA